MNVEIENKKKKELMNNRSKKQTTLANPPKNLGPNSILSTPAANNTLHPFHLDEIETKTSKVESCC